MTGVQLLTGAQRSMRRLGITIASILIMVFWAAALPADDAPGSRLSDDTALIKATISLLAARDFAAVRERFDPAVGKISDDALSQMSNAVSAAKEAASIETISAKETHNLQTGDGSSWIYLEYSLPARKWLVVDAVVKTEGDSKRFLRLFVTPNAGPLKELNAFYLLGKGMPQYLFLLTWIAVIAVTGFAMVVAYKRQTGWRRWAFIALMPLGLTPTVAMNWNTGYVWVLEATSNAAGSKIPLFAVRYPMTLFAHTETYVPYLYISAPLFALGYLIWQFRRRKPEVASA
jgi:hypothetical protein